MLYWLFWIITFPIVFLLAPTRIIGKKFIKKIKKEAYIFSGNHQSGMDGVIVKYRVSPNAKIMGKSSLFKGKIANKFFRWYGVYPVNRGGNDITAVKTTLKYLKENKHIIIFPEGTRFHESEEMALKNGVAMFALKTDCYVVPAIFRRKPKIFVPNTLLIGKPFKFSELEEFRDKKIDKDLLNRASDYLRSKMQYLKFVKIKDFKKEIKQDLLDMTNCK